MSRKKFSFSLLADHVYLSLLSALALFPLLWVLLCSVKSKQELMDRPTALLPHYISWDSYRHILGQMGFVTNILNSLWVALAATAATIFISALGAYGIVRFCPRLGKKLTRLMIMSYMFPSILLAVPYSTMMMRAGLTNTRLGLVIVYLSFSVPYAIWLLVGFFGTVPLEIEEAARVDGAARLQVFLQVALPITMPGIVATAIYTFINAWNEFLFALILINSTGKMTVSVALNAIQGAEYLDWGDVMAASTLVVMPSVVFFMFIQKRIAGGLAQGAVK
ncbi:ABC transporter permease [Oscillospiraceae bacterium]|nr:ABC transporter permease [Oscillospiraceae bacterium]